ncbi:MAG: hypothetical protein LH624_10990, partial [Cryobacterium sp.]|nr:hypothetical protein [Cryobacterium sp.]
LRLSDALVLVAVKHRTRADDAEQIIDEASRLAINFLGTIVVPPNRTVHTTEVHPEGARRSAVRSEARGFEAETLFPVAKP